MSRKCYLCTSFPEKAALDKEIVEGKPISTLAVKYEVPYSTLYRHATSHLTRKISQALKHRDLAESNVLMERIDQIIVKAEDIFQRNYAQEKDGIALKALDSQRNTIDMLVRLSFNLAQSRQTELILQREKKSEDGQDLASQFVKDLAILTSRELKLLQRIQLKLRRQDPGIRIIPDEAPSNSRLQDIDFEEIDTPESNTSDSGKPGIKRGKYHSQTENVPEEGSEDAQLDQEDDNEPDQEVLHRIAPIKPVQLTYVGSDGRNWTKDSLGRRRRE